MPKEYLLPFVPLLQPDKIVKSKTKTKYTCPGCEANVWGKEGMMITCGECDEKFEVQ